MAGGTVTLADDVPVALVRDPDGVPNSRGLVFGGGPHAHVLKRQAGVEPALGLKHVGVAEDALFPVLGIQQDPAVLLEAVFGAGCNPVDLCVVAGTQGGPRPTGPAGKKKRSQFHTLALSLSLSPSLPVTGGVSLSLSLSVTHSPTLPTPALHPRLLKLPSSDE